MTRRLGRALALAGLVGGGLVALAASPVQGVPSTYQERWCADANPAPCVVSAKRNGVALTSSDSQFEVQSTGELSVDGVAYFGFLVAQAPGGSTALSVSDTWQFTFDTGSMQPAYTEAFAGVPDVDRVSDGDGTYHVTYTAKPILYTTGCDENASWPLPCTETATSEEVKLQVEVQDRSGTEFANFDRSQSPQSVNGIFLETATDGSRYLSSEMVNSHFLTDGSTVYHGEVRFRIPYAMLRDSFGVPDPSTMVASSLSGTVNGSATMGTWSVAHDPKGGGMFVDVSDLTFSVKRIKVRRGTITPTRPTITRTTRISATSGRIAYSLSRARGAKVTGYDARCVSAGGHVVTKTKTTPTSPISVGGLKRGTSYTCKVRARSKVGPSTWSLGVKLAARP
jgi:hypothetical protein